MSFWRWLWWKIEEAGMEETIYAYAQDNFEEFPPSKRDELYFELFIYKTGGSL